MSKKHQLQIILSLSIIAIGFIWALSDVTLAAPRPPRNNQELLKYITEQYPDSYNLLHYDDKE